MPDPKPHKDCKARHDPCPEVALPAPRKQHLGGATPDDHWKISRQFIDQAKCEFEKGDRLQASEKIWGAASHAVKAVAAEQGWNHRGHENIVVAANILERAHNRLDITKGIEIAEAHHRNFYNNEMENRSIRSGIRIVEGLVDELDDVSKRTPSPVTVRDVDDQNGVARLLQVPRRKVNIGDTIEGNQLKDANGQVKHTRMPRPRLRRSGNRGGN